MRDVGPGRIMGPRQQELASGPERPGPRFTGNRREDSPMQTVKIAARYTRYLLTSLATVAFGLNAN